MCCTLAWKLETGWTAETNDDQSGELLYVVVCCAINSPSGSSRTRGGFSGGDVDGWCILRLLLSWIGAAN